MKYKTKPGLTYHVQKMHCNINNSNGHTNSNHIYEHVEINNRQWLFKMLLIDFINGNKI